MLAAATLLIATVGCTKGKSDSMGAMVDPMPDTNSSMMSDGVVKSSETVSDDLDSVFLGSGVQSSPGAEIPPMMDPPPSQMEQLSSLQSRVSDVFFDFDRAVIRDQDKAMLMANAELLKNNPSLSATVEGHADDRGTTAYNLSLGERRAVATRRYLIALGVSPAQLQAVSLGEEQPQCTDATESCWAQNRRAHLTLSR